MLVRSGKRESLGEEECISPRFKDSITESLLMTVFGGEFQTAGAVHRKAHFSEVHVVCGSHSVVMGDRR